MMRKDIFGHFFPLTAALLLTSVVGGKGSGARPEDGNRLFAAIEKLTGSN